MRGQENPLASMFNYVSLEQRVPKDHPLRTLRALLVQILFPIRCERQLVEPLDYNLLFRWFVG